MYRRAACPNEAPDFGVAVRLQIIQEHDIARPQARGEELADPRDEGRAVDSLPLRIQRDPTGRTDGVDHRQVLALVHRPRLDVLVAPSHLRVGSPHRQIRARFIEDDEAGRLDPSLPPQIKVTRLAWTSGRSISLGRGCFFEHVSRPMDRPDDARPTDPRAAGHPAHGSPDTGMSTPPAHPPGVAGQASADRESSSDVLFRSDVSATGRYRHRLGNGRNPVRRAR